MITQTRRLRRSFSLLGFSCGRPTGAGRWRSASSLASTRVAPVGGRICRGGWGPHEEAKEAILIDLAQSTGPREKDLGMVGSRHLNRS
jgi:hypothetical protein